MALIAALLLEVALLLEQISKDPVHYMQLFICPMCLFFSVRMRKEDREELALELKIIIFTVSPHMARLAGLGSGRNRMIRMKTRGLGLKACEQTHIFTYQKGSTMAKALTNQNDSNNRPWSCTVISHHGTMQWAHKQSCHHSEVEGTYELNSIDFHLPRFAYLTYLSMYLSSYCCLEMSNLPVKETCTESWDMVLFFKETKKPIGDKLTKLGPFHPTRLSVLFCFFFFPHRERYLLWIWVF